MSRENIVRFPIVGGLLKPSAIPDRPPPQPWYSGFPAFRKKLQIAPGQLVVVTGHPGHGKSTFVGNLVFNTVKAHDIGVVVATFETTPRPYYMKLLRQFYIGRPLAEMTDLEVATADEWIEDHYRFLVHPEDSPTLDWVMEWSLKAEQFKILIIDPWNRLESQRERDETETDYIRWALNELSKFAKKHDVCVIVVAHPAKRDSRVRDKMPMLEDIAGSKHWDNIPDQGIIVHRSQFEDEDGKRCWDANVQHAKSRHEELGYICNLKVRLNPRTWRYEDSDNPSLTGLSDSLQDRLADDDEPPNPF